MASVKAEIVSIHVGVILDGLEITAVWVSTINVHKYSLFNLNLWQFVLVDMMTQLHLHRNALNKLVWVS